MQTSSICKLNVMSGQLELDRNRRPRSKLTLIFLPPKSRCVLSVKRANANYLVRLKGGTWLA